MMIVSTRAWIAGALLAVLGASGSAQRSYLQQIGVPGGPSKSTGGDAGRLRPLQVSFDPHTRLVTIRLQVEDPEGYFIPNLRRGNFAVFEDGQPQTNVSVDVEHARISLSVLVQGGGRYQEINKILETEIPMTTRPLHDALASGDEIAVFSYADSVKTLLDVADPRDKLDAVFTQFRISGFSESNLYDAVLDVVNRTHTRMTTGRRALLLVSTGIDSFSHTTFDAMIADAGRAETPMYCIGLAGLVQASTVISTGPLAKLDWSRANTQLTTLAKTTGGRAYLRETALDVPAIYDDMMEHLRVRYVISYSAPNRESSGSTRKVRVALVDAQSGGPLRIVDATGKAITARVSTEASYTR
jgi:VWFA-related protein